MVKKKQRRKASKTARRGVKLRRDLLMALDLPAEVDISTPKVTLIGHSDLLLENHTGVLVCGDTEISLTTREGILRISGSGLLLRELKEGRAYIRGEINGVNFCE